MLLEVKHLQKTFDGKTAALADVSFGLDAGEFVSVIGPSGSGKTTLLRLLNGALRCDGGEILLDGEPFHAAKGRRRRRLQQRIGTIYQDFALVEQSSCVQNVLNACLPEMGPVSGTFGLFGAQRRAEAEALLARVGIAEKADEPVKNLSGGQKQRVAIARALMRHPAILLADEPVASLDPVTGRQILDLLADIQRKSQLTILMNSHNLALSLEYSQRIIGLRDGRVVCDGPAGELSEETIAGIYAGEGSAL